MDQYGNPYKGFRYRDIIDSNIANDKINIIFDHFKLIYYKDEYINITYKYIYVLYKNFTEIINKKSIEFLKELVDSELRNISIVNILTLFEKLNLFVINCNYLLRPIYIKSKSKNESESESENKIQNYLFNFYKIFNNMIEDKKNHIYDILNDIISNYRINGLDDPKISSYFRMFKLLNLYPNYYVYSKNFNKCYYNYINTKSSDDIITNLQDLMKIELNLASRFLYSQLIFFYN